jgi:hypothetical protein
MRTSRGSAEVVIDTDAIDALQPEMEEMKVPHAGALAKRDEQIERMRTVLPRHSPDSACFACALLERKLADLEKASDGEI